MRGWMISNLVFVSSLYCFPSEGMEEEWEGTYLPAKNTQVNKTELLEEVIPKANLQGFIACKS